MLLAPYFSSVCRYKINRRGLKNQSICSMLDADLCIPKSRVVIVARGDRTPYKRTHIPYNTRCGSKTWLHPARGVPQWPDPVKTFPGRIPSCRSVKSRSSRRGYIPSRGIPRWPDHVSKTRSVPWLPDPVQTQYFSPAVTGSRTKNPVEVPR